MALENVGVAAFLKFDTGGAVVGMAKAARATNGLAAAQQRLGRMVSRAGASFGGLLAGGVAGGVGTLGAAAGLREAGKFEEQMNTVRAVAGGTEEEFKTLTSTALNMGTGMYGPVQVGRSMEDLARAGFSAQEVVEGLPGVMNAAAAEGMPLAESARIISQAIRGMGLEAKDMTRVADVLAKGSATTNSSIMSLGSGLSYVSGAAHGMGMSLETTVGLLGVLENAGQRGSRAGTNLQQMLSKLSNPNKKAAEWMGKHAIAMRRFEDGSFNVVGTLTDIDRALSKETNTIERARLRHELFGERGGRAMQAIGTAARSGKLAEVQAELENAAGAAKKMADIRFSGFLAGVTKIKNSLTALSIQGFQGLVKTFGPGAQEVASKLKDVVTIVQELLTDTPKTRREFENTFGPGVTAMAYGFVAGIDAIRTSIHNAWVGFKTFSQTVFGFSNSFTEKAVKWAVLIAGVGAAVTPVIVAFSGLALFITSVVVPTIAALGWPITLAFAAVAAAIGTPIVVAFAKSRKEGEKWSTTVQRFALKARDAFREVSDAIYVLSAALAPAVKLTAMLSKAAMVSMAVATFGPLAWKKLEGDPLYQAVSAAASMDVELNPAKIAENMKKELRQRRDDRQKEDAEGAAQQYKADANRGIDEARGKLKALTAQLYDKDWNAAQLKSHKNDKNLYNAFRQRQLDELKQKEMALDEAAGYLASTNMKEEELAKIGGSYASMSTEGRAKTAADMAASINESLDKRTADANKPPKLEATLEDKRTIAVHNCVQVDGRELAKAYGKHQLEIQERTAFKATPFQRRTIAEQGAIGTQIRGGR